MAALQKPVSIVGAGLGGLTLARLLKKQGIPAVLYERNRASPRNNYGITLHSASYHPLLEQLGIEEKVFKASVAVDGDIGGAGFIDPTLLAYPRALKPGSFRANRRKLERLLQEGLDIEWAHQIEQVGIDSVGRPSFFQISQQPHEQEIIIGADGIHSSIRSATITDCRPQILPFVAFNGRKTVLRETFEQLYAPEMKNSNMIEIWHNGALLHVSVVESSPTEVRISWIYSRTAHGTTDPCFRPDRQLSEATAIPSEFYEEISKLSSLPSPFEDVFDATRIRQERVLSWLMRTTSISPQHLHEIAEQGIVMLGDSVRAQPILGGEGANAAIIDAIELARCISNNGSQSVKQWYTARYSAWQESKRASEHAIEQMHKGPKPSL
ncbi:hypothetical protein AAFC00_002401 [Neodothiora populina]|uniref:FAD-binding domain-containing protein n=1 Tax=Neodothiora populina TaxID=2781224 RepID=A0ABR3P799_9PEZI